MADRTCERCGTRFQNPSKLKRHLTRKSPCVQLSDGEAFPCRYCGKTFAQRSGRSRHEVHRCLQKPEDDALAAPGTAAALETKIDQLQQQIAALRPITAAVLAQKAPGACASGTLWDRQQISIDQLDHSQHIHGPVVHGDVHVQVQINNFGEENVEGLGAEIGSMLDALPESTPGESIISRVLGLIYRNPKRPENQTIRIMNKRDNIPYIKTRAGWQSKAEVELYPQIIDRACNELQVNQDFRLADTEEGRKKLSKRSIHVRKAFDAERASLVDPKGRARMVRPLFY